MAKRVGLSRNLKLPWLNKTAELCLEGLSDSEIRDQLNEYLSFEIGSPTNLRKTREILMNTWVFREDDQKTHRDEGLHLMNMDPDNALPIHWCQMLVTYPVFADITRLIGKMSEFEDTLSTAQIKRKLFDEWGERTTLHHSADKLLATLKAMDAIEPLKTGIYIIKKHPIRDKNVIHYLLWTMMTIYQRDYYSFNDLLSPPFMFPFIYQIKKEDILSDSRFALNSFGGELTIGLKH